MVPNCKIITLFGFTFVSSDFTAFPLYKSMQDENTSGLEDENIDWDSEDEREIDNIPLSSISSLTVPGREAATGSAEV